MNKYARQLLVSQGRVSWLHCTSVICRATHGRHAGVSRFSWRHRVANRHACACKIKTATLAQARDTSYCRAQMRAGSSSGAKECRSKYQRLNKAVVRILTRFVVRRAPVAPLRLASRLALHRHRLRIMRARSSESTIGCSHFAGCRNIYGVRPKISRSASAAAHARP